MATDKLRFQWLPGSPYFAGLHQSERKENTPNNLQVRSLAFREAAAQAQGALCAGHRHTSAKH